MAQKPPTPAPLPDKFKDDDGAMEWLGKVDPDAPPPQWVPTETPKAPR